MAQRRQRGRTRWPRRARSCSRTSRASPATATTRRARGAAARRACSAAPCSSRTARPSSADEAYLRESILNPQAKVVAGFQPIMPTFQGLVTRGAAAAADRVRASRSTRSPGRRPHRRRPRRRCRSAANARRGSLASEIEASSADAELSAGDATRGHHGNPELPERRLRPRSRGCSRTTTSASRCCTWSSITVFFFLGGVFAVADPARAADARRATWSRQTPTTSCSRMHGVVMVFFFLIPSIPAVLGNFLIPIMIGAKDLAFPRLNLLSWYIYVLGGAVHAVRDRSAAASTPAGRSTRRTAPRPRTRT